MSLIIKDKEGYTYVVWSRNKRAVLKSQLVSCNDVICNKKTCTGCVFAIDVDNSFDRNLKDFEIIQK